MAIYGWRNWTRSQQQEGGGIGRWPLRYHAGGGGRDRAAERC